MSWHYLQEQEAASWEGSCLDGAPSALLSLIPMQEKSCLPDNLMDVLTDSLSGMMSKPLMGDHGKGLLTLCLEDSHVKIFQVLEKAQELLEPEVAYGDTWQELFMKYDHASSLLKTHHCLWEEVLPLYSVTLPGWGMMQDGVFWELVIVGAGINGNDAGCWPTPLKNEGPGAQQMKLTDAIAVQEGYKPKYYKIAGMEDRQAFNGKVNPEWAEWLMGWPMGWTDDLQELGMDKFQQWLDLHGRHSLLDCKPSLHK